MPRTLVIGDIHGGFKALEQLLDRANVVPDDKLIFLGDYVDGWSQSFEVINKLIFLSVTHDCVFLRGNHDQLFYDWLAEQKESSSWLQQGGQATLDSYKDRSYDHIKKHCHFFENLENYYLDNQNRLFVHAGFTDLRGVRYESFSKTFYWDRSLWELALISKNLSKQDPFFPEKLKNYKEIFIGHTPLTKINKDQPYMAAGVWNLDTGAAFKNSLTMMDVDSKEFWQSDALPSLYPNEKGRNS